MTSVFDKGPGPKRILAIDGGGMRGALAVGMLSELEATLRGKLGRPDLVLADYFDLIGGTSTGAIIAAGLALGRDTAYLRDLYFRLGPLVFGHGGLRLPLIQSRFDPKALERVIVAELGDVTLGDAAWRTGFAAVANHLAEDHQIGDLLVQTGWDVRLSSYTIDTRVNEVELGALFRHEVRWAHTVRAVRPADHILSVVTCILPLLLVLFLVSPSWWGGGVIALYLLLRLRLDRAVNARLTLTRRAPAWLVPVSECLCFAVWLYATFSRAVLWRGQPFKLLSGGRLVPLEPRVSPIPPVEKQEAARH